MIYNISMFNLSICNNLMYKELIKNSNGLKIYSKKTFSFHKLMSIYSIQQIKKIIMRKFIILIPCGTCEICKEFKKNNYINRVLSQSQSSKYSYLITLSFDNDNIFCLLNKDIRQQLEFLSPFTSLSKNIISNIIRNLKKKINNYYKEKVQFHYILCGEYGENTDRAHYHILLMLDRPLPKCTQLPIRGNHIKCELFNTTQFNFYDIEPVLDNKKTSKYITKYLTKSNNLDLSNFNIFETKQLVNAIENNFKLNELFLFSSKQHLFLFLILISTNLLLFNQFKPKFFKSKFINNQRPFIKMSRRLGIKDDLQYCIDNKVLNSYYLSKFKDKLFNLLYWIFTIPTNHLNTIYYYKIVEFFSIYLYYLLSIFDYLERKRQNNVILHFAKYSNINKDKIYKNNDIF